MMQLQISKRPAMVPVEARFTSSPGKVDLGFIDKGSITERIIWITMTPAEAKLLAKQLTNVAIDTEEQAIQED